MTPVLIAGAGPTGLAVACGLLAMGVQARIVDAADGPAATSRALGLQPRGVEVLDRLGALADLPERSVRVAGTVIRVGGQEKLRLVVPPGEVLGGRTALIISQAEIEAQLRRRVAELGGHVEWGRELTDAEQDPGGVRVTFAGGEDTRAAWVVGCDGAGSRVRKATGIRLVGETAAERFLLADVRLELPGDRDYGAMWIADGGALAAVPLPGENWWRLMAPNPPGEPDELDADRVLDLFAQGMRERIGDALPGPGIQEAAWTSTFRIHRRLASAYRRGRVLLAGDAAHIHSPVGGQGMNTGLGDAENLAWKLALVVDGRARPALLDTYEAERRPVAQAVVRSVGGIDKLLLSTNPVVRFLRERLLIPAVNRPAVQRRIWRQASQLGISYRRGPLARHAGSRFRGRRPGDRVPDLACRRSDGTETRLHAELGGTWGLLVGSGSPAPGAVEAVRERLGADQVRVLVAPGWPAGRAALVRPDAHLATHGPARGDHLARWLDAVLHPGTATG